MRDPRSLDAYLRQVLPDIDKGLSDSGNAPYERPMFAAIFIVNHLIKEVQGGTKDSYFEQPWFAALYRSVEGWFCKKYGEKLMKAPNSDAIGAVEFQGLLLPIRVLLVLPKPSEDGTLWLTFAKEVLPGENPLNWLESAPPLDRVSSKRRSALAAECELVANQLRGIQNDLLTAGAEWPRPDVLRASVLHHLSKAATDAASGEREVLSLAIWELQMACEKTMKGYFAQRGVTFPETHNLRALHKIAAIDATWSEAKAALAGFPSEARVIRLRYSEDPPPSSTEFMLIYRSALTICRFYAGRMSRKYEFNNFAIQLRRPPWLGEVPESANVAQKTGGVHPIPIGLQPTSASN